MKLKKKFVFDYFFFNQFFNYFDIVDNLLSDLNSLLDEWMT